MAETNHIKVALKRFGYMRHPTVNSPTVGLGVNSTKFIMTMDKPVIDEIKKRLGDLIYPNDTAADRVDCGLQTMRYI